RIGADPIKRYTKSGFPVAHFSVATSRKIYKDAGSQASPSQVSPSQPSPGDSAAPPSPHSIEETKWHQIVTWGKQADACSQNVKKGHAVYVEGMIKSRNWENKVGKQKTTYEIHSESVSFLGWPKGESTEPTHS